MLKFMKMVKKSLEQQLLVKRKIMRFTRYKGIVPAVQNLTKYAQMHQTFQVHIRNNIEIIKMWLILKKSE